MGRKDLSGKDFFADRERFAELINTVLYNGKAMVRVENLIPMKREYVSPLGNGEKRRDILMSDISQNIGYGLELETESDYGMPERVMGYDICEWETQIKEIGRRYEKRGYRDKKSRIGEKDRLMPVITIVLYLGVGRWKGRRKLSELFQIPEEMKELLGSRVPEYDFQLTEADYVNADACRTDLREFFRALQCRKDKKKLAELLRSERFRNLKPETAWVIAVHLDRERLTDKMKKEGMDMCQALDELMEDKRCEGRLEGKREGRLAGKKEEKTVIINRMLQEGMDRALICRIADCTEEEMELAAGSAQFAAV